MQTSLASSAAETNSTTATQEEEDDDPRVAAGGVSVNPTVETLQEGIAGLLRPSVEAIDARVEETRRAQAELRANIDLLTSDLEAIRAAQQEGAGGQPDLEAAIEKLNSSKKRVVVVANLLKGAQDRLNRVHRDCARETAKRRTLLEPANPTTAASVVPNK